MNEIIINEEMNIANLIYEVRGKQVMLDSDLARLYHCTNGTKDINKAVKRNSERFPDDFYFELTSEECENISRFQNGTLKIERGYNLKYLPHCFTEEGIAMLATVIRTDIAAKASINIMRAFVRMHRYIRNDLLEQKYINDMVITHDSEIKLLQDTLKKLEEKKIVNEIYFNGQIYDAYSKIIDILNEGSREIVIIDGYADKSVLDIIKNIKINIILITKKNGLLKKIDIDKYNKQYNNLKIVYDNTFHDRYIILDKNKVYHLGASINHAGSKTFSINILDDNFVIDELMKLVTILVK